jgi:hypothetical protein
MHVYFVNVLAESWCVLLGLGSEQLSVKIALGSFFKRAHV